MFMNFLGVWKWVIISTYKTCMNFGCPRIHHVCILVIFDGGRERGERDKHVCTFKRRSEALTLSIGQICQHHIKFVSDKIK